MIWVWILLSVAVTAFLLRNKNIAPHNFLWALVPIDRYGIVFMDVIIKPVFIYSLLIVAYSIISKNFKLKLTRAALYPTFALGIFIIMSALFRGNVGIIGDVKIYGMMYIAIVLGICSMSLVEGKDDLRQIKDVLIASAVGYGFVFLLLFYLNNAGISLPAVESVDVLEASIIHSYKYMSNGSVVDLFRLRGFCGDPNFSCLCFLVGFSALLSDWIKNGNHVRNTVYALIITANIVLTNSRAGIIVEVMIIVISVARLMMSQVKSRKKIIFFCVVIAVLFAGFVLFMFNNKLLSYVVNNFLSNYSTRVGFNHELGRGQIWKESLATLNGGNWYYGTGYGNIQKLIEAEKNAHNTYLEILCSSGVFVGIAYVVCIISPLIFALKCRINDTRNKYHITNIALMHLSVCIMLFTISAPASVYLIYFSYLLFIIPGVLEDEESNSAIK